LIYGYEPFKPTFNKALANIDLNPHLKDKISACNYGLGSRELELECDYSYENTSGSGINGILGKKGKNICKEWIRILPIADEISRIKQRFGNYKLVMKVDCEGCEFEIIEDLDKKVLLGSIDVILLEWHEKNPKVIIDSLNKYGFAVYSRNNFCESAGMFFALRTS